MIPDLSTIHVRNIKHFPGFRRRGCGMRLGAAPAAFAICVTVLLMAGGCGESAATREARRERTTTYERERPLTVAKRDDTARPRSRSTNTRRPYTPSSRSSTASRAHIEPTPAGYDDAKPPATRTASRASAKRPLRRIEPSEREPRYSPPVDSTAAPASSDSYVAPPPVGPAPETGMRVYHVQRGDTLWSLANKFYGDSKHWRRILAANRNRVPDPRNLPVGIKLIIP